MLTQCFSRCRLKGQNEKTCTTPRDAFYRALIDNDEVAAQEQDRILRAMESGRRRNLRRTNSNAHKENDNRLDICIDSSLPFNPPENVNSQGLVYNIEPTQPPDDVTQPQAHAPPQPPDYLTQSQANDAQKMILTMLFITHQIPFNLHLNRMLAFIWLQHWYIPNMAPSYRHFICSPMQCFDG